MKTKSKMKNRKNRQMKFYAIDQCEKSQSKIQKIGMMKHTYIHAHAHNSPRHRKIVRLPYLDRFMRVVSTLYLNIFLSKYHVRIYRQSMPV